MEGLEGRLAAERDRINAELRQRQQHNVKAHDNHPRREPQTSAPDVADKRTGAPITKTVEAKNERPEVLAVLDQLKTRLDIMEHPSNKSVRLLDEEINNKPRREGNIKDDLVQPEEANGKVTKHEQNKLREVAQEWLKTQGSTKQSGFVESDFWNMKDPDSSLGRIYGKDAQSIANILNATPVQSADTIKQPRSTPAPSPDANSGRGDREGNGR